MIRRLGLAVLVAGTALSGLAGISVGTASAAPACPDFHWIGAAGSGQRDAAGLAYTAGMGSQVYQSYLQLSDDLAADGQTITAEAVDYPAVPVPVEGGIGGWMGFMGSVDDGVDAMDDQFVAYTEQCPDTKVVLAGYSQGAMVIHRNLYKLADDPHVAAALLIADGDRLPVDTTLNMGTTAVIPSTFQGVAQEHSILASTNTSKLPPEMGAKTVSVCDVGDPVCDYDPNSDEITPAALAIHTAYAPTASGPHAWVGPLYGVVSMSPPLQAPTSTMSGHTE